MLIDATMMQSLLTFPTLIAELERADRGAISAPPREHHQLDSGTLLSMSAWSAEAIGTKLVSVFPHNAHFGLPTVFAQYLLMCGQTGEPRAVIDGTELTLWRTAAVSALASAKLARINHGKILVIGTGALAPYLLAAHCAVHQSAKLALWGRNRTKAEVARDRCAAFGLRVEIADDLELAVRSADIVSCATSSSDPIVAGRWLSRHSHLDLVGGYTPAMREADDGAMVGADIVVDTTDAISDAGDLSIPISAGLIGPERIRTLAEIIAKPPARQFDRTVFKSIGSAANDLIVAHGLWRRISGLVT